MNSKRLVTLIKNRTLKLHLIRHAKTEAQSTSGQDFDRQLQPRGHEQCKETFKHLKKKDLHRIIAWYSTAKRTSETWQNIRDAIQTVSVDAYPDLYLCEKDIFLQRIWAEPRTEDIFIVAHNNGISDFGQLLLGTDLIMKTSEYLEIDFEIDNWIEASRDLGTLTHRYRSEA